MSGLIILCLCQTVNGNEEYEYVLKSQGLNGYNELGITPVIMELYNREGKKLEVYCADMNTPVVSGCGYNCKPIDKCNKFDRNICKHLEKILKNAYPYISIEEMQQRSGIKYIKKKEAITAVQYAIWHYTNNADIESEYSVVNELCKWLINLDINDSSNDDGENNGGKTKSIFLAINNNVATQILIGIWEFTESESDTSKESESSTPEENNTTSGEENNTTGENNTTSGEENNTTGEDNTTGKNIKSSSEGDTTDKLGNIIKGGNISKDTKQEDIIKANVQYDKSPKTGDNFVSIVVIMGVALSMVTIFIVLRGKRN